MLDIVRKQEMMEKGARFPLRLVKKTSKESVRQKNLPALPSLSTDIRISPHASQPAEPSGFVDIARTFSRNLVRLRNDRHLTRRAAAGKLGVAESTWSQWEAGKRFPNSYFLALVGSLFDVCPGKLIVDCTACSQKCPYKEYSPVAGQEQGG